MIPQEPTEKMARMSRTALEIGLELARISSRSLPELVGNKFPTPCSMSDMAGLPGVRKTALRYLSYRAPLGQRAPVWDSRCFVTGRGSPVSDIVKHMATVWPVPNCIMLGNGCQTYVTIGVLVISVTALTERLRG